MGGGGDTWCWQVRVNMDIGLNERGQCDERWRRGDARHACSAQTQLENKRMRSGGRYEKRMFRMPLQRASVAVATGSSRGANAWRDEGP